MAGRRARKAEVLPVEPVVHDAELVLPPKRKSLAERRAEQEEMLGGIKNKIFGASMKVVGDYLRAGDIDPSVDRDRDPAYFEMMTELGDEEEVKKAYRIASAGWLPAAECPGFVKVAANMAIGIMKANAAEKGGPKVLNVQRIVISADAIPQFEEREVE